MSRLRIISILVGIAALAALVSFIRTPREMEPVVIYKTTRLNTSKADPTATTDAPHLNTENSAQFPRANATPGDTAPDAQGHSRSAQQRLKSAMASPAYLEYSRKQAEQVGFNVVLYWEFLEANGIQHNGRQLQAAAFEKHFPEGGDYADYEPMMQLAVAEMFLEDPSQSVMDVLQRFNATRSNRVWRFGYFNGYEGEYEWGQQIQRDAVDIVANAIAGHDTFEVPSPRIPHFSETERVPRGVVETGRPPEVPSHAPEEMSSFEEMEMLPESFEALETQFFQGLETEIPAFPTDAGLEPVLRERFSPQRFQTATQTLRRYGTEEGMRRLRASDPEVATHIQRFRNRDNTPSD